MLHKKCDLESRQKSTQTKHPEIAQISDLGNKDFKADIINMSKKVKEVMVSVIR